MSFNKKNISEEESLNCSMTETQEEEDEFLDFNDAIEIIDPEGPSNAVQDDEDFEDDDSNTAALDSSSRDLPPEEGVIKTATRTFKAHKEPVLHCAVSQCGSVVVTGGQDDVAYVWGTYTGDVLIKCTGHKESVAMVALSHDGQYAATGDLAGLVQVWRVREGDVCFSFDTATDVQWLCWHPTTSILLCGTISGEVWVWLVPRQTTKTLSGPGNPSTCGALTQDGKRIAVGYEDGSVRVHDIKMEIHKAMEPGSKHSEEVTCIDSNPDNVLGLTGSRDGTAKFFNANTGKVLSTVELRKYNGGSEEEGVEAVGFCSSHPFLALIAGGHGTVVVYDVGRQDVRHRLLLPEGVTRICFSPNSSSVFIGGTEGCIRQYDILSGRQLARWTGHTDNILELSIDKSGSILVSASDDETARVFSVGGASSSLSS